MYKVIIEEADYNPIVNGRVYVNGEIVTDNDLIMYKKEDINKIIEKLKTKGVILKKLTEKKNDNN